MRLLFSSFFSTCAARISIILFSTIIWAKESFPCSRKDKNVSSAVREAVVIIGRLILKLSESKLEVKTVREARRPRLHSPDRIRSLWRIAFTRHLSFEYNKGLFETIIFYTVKKVITRNVDCVQIRRSIIAGIFCGFHIARQYCSIPMLCSGLPGILKNSPVTLQEGAV